MYIIAKKVILDEQKETFILNFKNSAQQQIIILMNNHSFLNNYSLVAKHIINFKITTILI